MSDAEATAGAPTKDGAPAEPTLPPGIPTCVGASVGIACFLIAVLSLVLPYDGKAAIFLLDHDSHSLFLDLYPITIQNFLHVLSATCLGILYHRWRRGRFERGFLDAKLLPTEEHVLINFNDLGKIRRRIVPLIPTGASLPALMDTAILVLQNTKSAEQAESSVTSRLELISHRLDLEYQFVRYIAWLVPTVGFIGTVVGIAAALDGINPDHLDMARITSGLGVAFYTTIIALMESAVLVFVQNVVQRQEELSLNGSAEYCVVNLIHRLYYRDA